MEEVEVVVAHSQRVTLRVGDVIRAWWSLRSLVVSHWLIEHGFDPDTPGAEFDVLRSRMRE